MLRLVFNGCNLKYQKAIPRGSSTGRLSDINTKGITIGKKVRFKSYEELKRIGNATILKETKRNYL